MKGIVFALCILALLSGGCAELNKTQTGTRTTVKYGNDGITPVAAVSEEVAVGDPTSEQYSAIRTTAEASASVVKAKAEAIQNIIVKNPAKSAEAAAWQAAFATVAVERIEDNTARNIAAIPKATTGYDVARDAIGMVKDVAIGKVIADGVTGVVESVAASAGDKIVTNVSGKNNQVSNETAKTNIHSTTTSSSSGESSPSTASNTPNAGGATTGSSGGAQSGSSEDGMSSSSLKAFNACASGSKTQGQVASCMKGEHGVDVKIEGGITYVDGEDYNLVNDYDYAEPK